MWITLGIAGFRGFFSQIWCFSCLSSLYIRLWPFFAIHRPLWRNPNRLSTLSTGLSPFYIFPYLLEDTPIYRGIPPETIFQFFTNSGQLSTTDPSYPQFVSIYPQFLEENGCRPQRRHFIAMAILCPATAICGYISDVVETPFALAQVSSVSSTRSR